MGECSTMNNKINIRIELDGILNIDKRRKKYDNATIHAKEVLKFIEKLSKNFSVTLMTKQNEILAAKWLIDNDMLSLIPCLLNKEEIFVLYIDAKCLNNCQDFDEFYNVLMSL